ncbi:periplasmic binding protein-like II [Anaeromyces robustus]|uniref:Periplasmic binding protein-like II n=1 Tax=Anaeromyces robustus TaxID=1754192 RepID=A0A1Y1XES7_9FUNG|nr:periplasmic binding protein-like II [Anaeromyces robustus]|eukprot:ORX84281.1 periplasmic binding protein-like II [Anaeromyces robustus]
MNKIFIKIILFQLILILRYSNDSNDEVYLSIFNEFNTYANENDLDIQAKLHILSNTNSTTNKADFGSSTEVLLKKYNKYDIYVYDNLYIANYGKYLLDLKDYFTQDYLNLYNQNLLNQTCYYKDELVGLPISLAYTVLYSNRVLLSKYNKKIPKTWDELLETSKFILNEEKKLNNTNIIGYNGLFTDDDFGICSIYEFIYSCRESYNSTFPELTSEVSINSLEKLKQIKDEISSDSVFRTDNTLNSLKNGDSLFLKYFITPEIFFKHTYDMSILPGIKEGISGAIVAGYNVGIFKNLSEEKKFASLAVLQFISSPEMQKKYFLKQLMISGILTLFDDEEVCQACDCEVFKNLQPIGRPSYKIPNYDEYSEKFRQYIYEFLYGDLSAEKALKKADDITRIYYISINKNYSLLGFIINIIISILTLLMFFSLIFLFVEDFCSLFEFLTTDFWFIYVLGSIFILCSVYTKYGIPSSSKCHWSFILFFSGLNLNYIPIIYRLIINFPIKNNVILWIENHKYKFISIFIIMEGILNGLSLTYEYDIKNIMNSEGQNYQICKMKNMFGKILFGITMLYIILLISLILVYVFIEWNIKKTTYETRAIVTLLYIDILSFVILFLFDIIIKVKQFYIYFIIYTCMIVIISMSNYGLLYGIKIIDCIIKRKSFRLTFVNSVNKDFIPSEAPVKTCELTFGSGAYSSNNNSACIATLATNNNNSSGKIFNDDDEI